MNNEKRKMDNLYNMLEQEHERLRGDKRNKPFTDIRFNPMPIKDINFGQTTQTPAKEQRQKDSKKLNIVYTLPLLNFMTDFIIVDNFTTAIYKNNLVIVQKEGMQALVRRELVNDNYIRQNYLKVSEEDGTSIFIRGYEEKDLIFTIQNKKHLETPGLYALEEFYNSVNIPFTLLDEIV